MDGMYVGDVSDQLPQKSMIPVVESPENLFGDKFSAFVGVVRVALGIKGVVFLNDLDLEIWSPCSLLGPLCPLSSLLLCSSLLPLLRCCLLLPWRCIGVCLLILFNSNLILLILLWLLLLVVVRFIFLLFFLLPSCPISARNFLSLFLFLQ